MNSFDTNYIFNNDKNLGQYDQNAIPIPDNAMLQLSWKFGEPKLNPYWVIVLKNWSGTNYVLNEHGDVDQ